MSTPEKPARPAPPEGSDEPETSEGGRDLDATNAGTLETPRDEHDTGDGGEPVADA